MTTAQAYHRLTRVNGQKFTMPEMTKHVPGQGTAGPVAGFITAQDAALKGTRAAGEGAGTAAALAQTAFIAKYPPTTPMIVGGIEEIRTDDAANEIYIADNAFGGRVMVFSLLLPCWPPRGSMPAGSTATPASKAPAPWKPATYV